MNYEKLYYQIIDKAKERNFTKEEYKERDVYVEEHHIIPTSLDGTDASSNLVFLTAREHFLCHYLLAKMYKKETLEWYKTNHAFQQMKCSSFCHDRYYNSRLYEALRGNFSSVMSFLQTGSKNSQYGTMWISNIDLKQNKKIKKTDEIPEGWVKGRKYWDKEDLIYISNVDLKQNKTIKKTDEIPEGWMRGRDGWKSLEKQLVKQQRKIEKQQRKQEKEAKREEDKQQRKQEKELKSKIISNELHKEFCTGNFRSLREFAKFKGVSDVSLVWRFKRHVQEYRSKSIERSPYSYNLKEN